MPMYEYVCDKCGFVDDYIHKMDVHPEFLCEDCGDKMRKALGLNFVLKGDGYYSKGGSAPTVKKIRQTVMGVEQSKVGELDAKVRRAPRAKPIEPA